MIKQWGSILSSGENKKELIRFLVSRWKESCNVVGNLDIYLSFDEAALSLDQMDGAGAYRN